jgi:hypothetical protein
MPVDLTNYPMQMTPPIRQAELASLHVAVGALAPDEPDVPVALAVTSHWIVFRIGDSCVAREFGIWRASGLVFEADETGAMGDEPVDIP